MAARLGRLFFRVPATTYTPPSLESLHFIERASADYEDGFEFSHAIEVAVDDELEFSHRNFARYSDDLIFRYTHLRLILISDELGFSHRMFKGAHDRQSFSHRINHIEQDEHSLTHQLRARIPGVTQSYVSKGG